MCQPASFIVTKDNVFWKHGSNSHEQIMKENNLTDSKDQRPPDFVRVEITPPNNDFVLLFEKWVYKVDQDMLPDWYVKDFDEERIRKELPKWYDSHIKGQITDINNITQTAGYRSTQTAGYRSTQTAGDDSTQTAGYRSTQTAGDESTQTAGYRSTQTAGVGTVQICRWYDNGWQVATRIITEETANKPYKCIKGVWTLIEENQ